MPTVTLADPGDSLALMILAHRRRDHRAVKRLRQRLRRHGLSVTLGKLDPHDQPGPLGFSLDQMLRAMAEGNYDLAGVHRRGLLREGVNVVPLAVPAERGAR